MEIERKVRFENSEQERKFELLKNELHRSIIDNGISHRTTILISEQLDRMIVEIQKSRI